MKKEILILIGEHIVSLTSLRGRNGVYTKDKWINCMSGENVVLIIDLNEYCLKYIKSEKALFNEESTLKYYKLIEKNK